MPVCIFFFFFFSGCNKAIIGASQLNSSLLTLSVIAVLLPAAFSFAFDNGSPSDEAHRILSVSHGVCLFLRLRKSTTKSRLFRLRSSSYSVSLNLPLSPLTDFYLSLCVLSVLSTLFPRKAIRRCWGRYHEVHQILSWKQTFHPSESQ